MINPKVAVLIPLYKGSSTLNESLESLRRQTFQNLKIYFRDNSGGEFPCEVETTKKIALTLSDQFEVEFEANVTNLGYPRNLIELVRHSDEEYIFLLAQDDVLSPIAIEACIHALSDFPNAAGVCRPYFWFDKSLSLPIREIPKLKTDLPALIDISSPWEQIELALVSASQLTGLMYRRSRLREAFIDSVFPAHIYPIAGALRDYGVVYLPFPTVAVSIRNSQTRNISSIYGESPAKAWISLYEKVFAGKELSRLRKSGIRIHMGKNFVGLIQIRSYGKYRYFLRELGVMIRARPLNVLDPRFILSAVGLAVLPRGAIIWIVDNFKSKLLARTLRKVRLAQQGDGWW